MDVIEQGLNYILNWVPPNFSFFVFSLALINAADVHSANIRGHLASFIAEEAAVSDFKTATGLLRLSSFNPPTNTRRQLAAIETNTVLIENHDEGHPAPTVPSLKPFTATDAAATATTKAAVTANTTGTSKPCTPKIGTGSGTVPLPTGITATPTTPTAKTLPATTIGTLSFSSIFLPEASCMLAIFSLIADIPTPGPALSTALDKAEDALAPSAVANPQCTITLPATLSSEYGVYTSRVDSWVSEHSKELNKLDSVCGETYSETGRMSAYTSRATGAGVTRSVSVWIGSTTAHGCTAPVAVFTGATGTIGGGGGSGSGSSTAKATGSSTGVVTSTKTGTGTATTTATVTSSVTSSITGSATTVAGTTSSQPASGPQAGGAARVTGVMAAAMMVAGLLAVVVVAM